MAAVPTDPGSLNFAAGSHFLPKGSVKKVPATESRGYDRAQSPSFSGFGGWHLFPWWLPPFSPQREAATTAAKLGTNRR